MWYTNPKSPGFVTIKDVTFDENYMLHPRKEFVVKTISSMEESSKQVKLESKASERVYSVTRVKSADISQSSTLNDGTPPPQ